MDIYRGSIPFVVIQIAMVTALIAFPGLVTFGLEKKVEVDLESIRIDVPGTAGGWGEDDGGWGAEPPAAEGATEPGPADAEKREQGWGGQRGW